MQGIGGKSVEKIKVLTGTMADTPYVGLFPKNCNERSLLHGT